MPQNGYNIVGSPLNMATLRPGSTPQVTDHLKGTQVLLHTTAPSSSMMGKVAPPLSAISGQKRSGYASPPNSSRSTNAASPRNPSMNGYASPPHSNGNVPPKSNRMVKSFEDAHQVSIASPPTPYRSWQGNGRAAANSAPPAKNGRSSPPTQNGTLAGGGSIEIPVSQCSDRARPCVSPVSPSTASLSNLIILDIDEVLLDLTGGFRWFYQETFPASPLPSDEELQWLSGDSTSPIRNAYLESSTFHDLPVVEGALHAVQCLKAAGHRLEAVTSRSPALEQVTQASLDRKFPGMISKIHFTNGRPKGSTCQRLGAWLLVDDAIENVKDAVAHGLCAVLFGDFSWNKHQSLPANIVHLPCWADTVQWIVKNSHANIEKGGVDNFEAVNDKHGMPEERVDVTRDVQVVFRFDRTSPPHRMASEQAATNMPSDIEARCRELIEARCRPAPCQEIDHSNGAINNQNVKQDVKEEYEVALERSQCVAPLPSWRQGSNQTDKVNDTKQGVNHKEQVDLGKQCVNHKEKNDHGKQGVSQNENVDHGKQGVNQKDQVDDKITQRTQQKQNTTHVHPVKQDAKGHVKGNAATQRACQKSSKERCSINSPPSKQGVKEKVTGGGAGSQRTEQSRTKQVAKNTQQSVKESIVKDGPTVTSKQITEVTQISAQDGVPQTCDRVCKIFTSSRRAFMNWHRACLAAKVGRLKHASEKALRSRDMATSYILGERSSAHIPWMLVSMTFWAWCAMLERSNLVFQKAICQQALESRDRTRAFFLRERSACISRMLLAMSFGAWRTRPRAETNEGLGKQRLLAKETSRPGWREYEILCLGLVVKSSFLTWRDELRISKARCQAKQVRSNLKDLLRTNESTPPICKDVNLQDGPLKVEEARLRNPSASGQSDAEQAELVKVCNQLKSELLEARTSCLMLTCENEKLKAQLGLDSTKVNPPKAEQGHPQAPASAENKKAVVNGPKKMIGGKIQELRKQERNNSYGTGNVRAGGACRTPGTPDYPDSLRCFSPRGFSPRGAATPITSPQMGTASPRISPATSRSSSQGVDIRRMISAPGDFSNNIHSWTYNQVKQHNCGSMTPTIVARALPYDGSAEGSQDRSLVQTAAPVRRVVQNRISSRSCSPVTSQGYPLINLKR